MSMNFVGEREPMHNHESGWEEEALENCGGAVRGNIIPKSLTYFTQTNVTFLTLFHFRQEAIKGIERASPIYTLFHR